MWIQLTLEQHGFELRESTYMQICFNKNTVDLQHPLVSLPWIQLTVDCTEYFQLMVGNLWMQRNNCMHCSVPFYMRDLSILGFWYLGGFLEPVPDITDKFLGNQKLYVDFQLHGSAVPQPPQCLRVSCIYVWIYVCLFSFTTIKDIVNLVLEYKLKCKEHCKLANSPKCSCLFFSLLIVT